MKLYRFFILPIILLLLCSCNEKNEEVKEYYVDSDNFIIHNVILNATGDYYIEYECDEDLVRLGVIYTFYDDENNIEYTDTKYITVNYKADSESIVIIDSTKYDGIPEVKLFGYASYEVDNEAPAPEIVEDDKKYTITFCNDSGILFQKTVVSGGLVANVSAPKVEGYNFDGWYRDKAFSRPFDIYEPVTENATVYAKYELDYAYLTNKISLDTIKSTVTIKYTASSNFQYQTSSGSGVIFDEDVYYYYILTNNHVLSSDLYNVVSEEITVVSYNMKEYNGTLIHRDYRYDLALIAISKDSENELKVIEMEDENPVVGDVVVALGTPKGQTNSIVYGKVDAYDVCNLGTYESQVTFSSVRHDAELNNGSSGGPLLNEELKLIGINFAVTVNANDGEYMHSFAVPIEKVKEFISDAS